MLAINEAVYTTSLSATAHSIQVLARSFADNRVQSASDVDWIIERLAEVAKMASNGLPPILWTVRALF
jgi:hypothetical protein